MVLNLNPFNKCFFINIFIKRNFKIVINSYFGFKETETMMLASLNFYFYFQWVCVTIILEECPSGMGQLESIMGRV